MLAEFVTKGRGRIAKPCLELFAQHLDLRFLAVQKLDGHPPHIVIIRMAPGTAPQGVHGQPEGVIAVDCSTYTPCSTPARSLKYTRQAFTHSMVAHNSLFIRLISRCGKEVHRILRGGGDLAT